MPQLGAHLSIASGWMDAALQHRKHRRADVDPIPDERTCECGYPARWASDPMSPVQFDERLNEYQLLLQNRGYARMRFCFWCGGRLPESKRGTLFTSMDDAELTEARSLLSGAKLFEDVVRVLGPPDETLDLGGSCAGRR